MFTSSPPFFRHVCSRPPPPTAQLRIPVASPLADARVTMESLCPPERHGGVISNVSIDPRRSGKPYRFVYGNCIVGARPCKCVHLACGGKGGGGGVDGHLDWFSLPLPLSISGAIHTAGSPAALFTDPALSGCVPCKCVHFFLYLFSPSYGVRGGSSTGEAAPQRRCSAPPFF